MIVPLTLNWIRSATAVPLAAVIAALLSAYTALSAREIAAHSDIAPGRKTDPGPAFDWLRLYDGLSVQLA